MSFRAPISLILAACLALSSMAAFAHHGWSWAEEEQMELTGTVTRVQIAPPHPWLDVETPDGTWRVELGNPSQTERAGFTAESAREGDTIKATGNRSKDQAEKRMKAVQIEVGGETYDIYPERIE
ncbi:DUF6152 family protein [Stutzerimonas azotifigens]|uniref:DUF6152 family protein n=1 Tax=Stutzerimonas azotifigens TaxID=291995 RepID=UPI00041D512A|nr:DUF6152 family protein [Stutzerimonas azotifigens]